MTPSLEGVGRQEATWRAWSAPATWPPAPLPTSGRVVVVAPHPDDAVLAVGGLLRLLADQGVAIGLVAVTDGEASHRGSPTLTPEELASRRVAESRCAFARLGVELRSEVRLGLPDAAVGAHEDEVADQLRDVIRPTDLVLVPWCHDGHPDHDAVGRAGARAARDLGARRWSYPVWAWHWGTPARFATMWSGAARVDLPPDVRSAKKLAIDAHASQVRPLSPAPGDEAILPPPVRARFERSWETVLT
jgi:LmbE family N-acetylglucosaminyl deacetylase